MFVLHIVRGFNHSVKKDMEFLWLLTVNSIYINPLNPCLKGE